MAQKVNGTEAKLALGEVDGETMLAEALTQQMEVGTMFLPRVASHENIVQVNEQKIKSPTHGIHQALERLRGILKAERHTKELEQTKWVIIAILDTSTSRTGQLLGKKTLHQPDERRSRGSRGIG